MGISMVAASTMSGIELGGRHVEYRLRRSKTSERLRVRVGPEGVVVVQPAGRDAADVEAFLLSHEEWVLGQMSRVEALRHVWRPRTASEGEILYLGEPTTVQVKESLEWRGPARISYSGSEIVVVRSALSDIPPERSLENWLRKQARSTIEKHLTAVCAHLNRTPTNVYVMGQRTKWGNCSARGNLSFNWRLIMAPEHVLRYIVVHEAVHLAVPDHSKKFWLTVNSLCPETERARQWLCASGDALMAALGPATGRPPQD